MTPPTSLEKLKTQRDALNARIQKMQALEITRERKKETRRKILVGAYILDKARKDNTLAQLSQDLDAFLTRDSDRELFELPEKSLS